VKQNSQRPAAAAADDHRGAEDPSRTAAADGQPGGHDFAQSDGKKDERPKEAPLSGWGSGHGMLKDPITEGQHGEHLTLPAEDIVETERHQPGEEGSD
jgi:hypothetical protein